MKERSLDQAITALFSRTASGIKPGLKVIRDLLAALDNPHQKLAVVHVAGTNGKGSVCAMLQSVLNASGFKTGLYTSPHLVHFAERFRVNGEKIAEKKLGYYIDLLEHVAQQVEEDTGNRGATFFEVSTALAYRYFCDEEVDIAIIETGMGGRWDATNVIIPLVSVITHIDIDHSDFLGDNLSDIAGEKAGIIKPGRPVVSAPQSDEVLEVLRNRDHSILLSNELVSVTKGKPGQKKSRTTQRLKIETQERSLPSIDLPLLGAHQRENCAVSVAVLELLANLIDFEPAYKKGLELTRWGSRFERMQDDPPILLDGAHNPSAANALVQTLREVFPSSEIGFVFGFLGDKDVLSFLKIIRPLVCSAWAVELGVSRSMQADHVVALAQSVGVNASVASKEEALSCAKCWAAQERGRVICVAGSLYLKQILF